LATLVLIGIILPRHAGISLATIAAGEAKHKVEAAGLAQTKAGEVWPDFSDAESNGRIIGKLPGLSGYYMDFFD